MTLYFANGFYDTSIHGAAIPAGAVAITAGEYLALLNAPALGKIVVIGSDGRPTLAAPPQPDPQGR